MKCDKASAERANSSVINRRRQQPADPLPVTPFPEVEGGTTTYDWKNDEDLAQTTNDVCYNGNAYFFADRG